MDYIFNILNLILIYAILVQSLNLIMGYAGVISLSHAVFYAIGAYTTALINIHFGNSFILAAVAGALIAAIVGALLAAPSLRVLDEYLIVFTLGFQMVAYSFMVTARSVTMGEGGITGIPSPNLLGFAFDSHIKFLPIALLIAAICFAVSWRVINSPFGRILKAIREDEMACRALGKNTLQFKIWVFALGGSIAAIAGSTLAHFITFISPVSFTIDVSIFIVVMVVLGGAANFWGPLIGAAILVGLPELLRFLPETIVSVDVFREILYGLILMFMMIFRPQGILPEYSGKPKYKKYLIKLKNDKIDTKAKLDNNNETIYIKEKSAIPDIEVKDISKSFGGLKAVNSASIVLEAGKTIGLIGPNGCGKTTLFNLITGILNCDEGKVFVRGKEITGQAPYKMISSGIVRSWQDIRIFKGMTVLENVLVSYPLQRGEKLFHLFLSPFKVAKEERDNLKKAIDYLDQVGMLDKADQLAGSLSTAEQKLVAIARLMATECPVLLLDEPTAALDRESVERIIKLIKSIAQKGRKTILLIEHNLDVVRGLVEKAYFMSEGKVIAFGEPSTLMSDSKLSEVYFGMD